MIAKLFVKGDRFQSAKAAADRGIGFVFHKEIRDKANGRSVMTIGFANVETATLAGWFAADLANESNEGYPIGSLLLWNYEIPKRIAQLAEVIPDSEPIGPFASEDEALEDARENAGVYDE